MPKRSVSLAKGIPLAFIALTGCVALVPTGFLDTVKSEATNKPTETPNSMASAMQTQTPAPSMSPSQSAKSPSPASGSSPSPSVGVATTPTPSASPKPTATPTLPPEVTPEPAVTPTPVPTPTPTQTPTPVPTPTPAPYAVSVIIDAPATNVLFLLDPYGGDQYVKKHIGPSRIVTKALVTMSDQSTSSEVVWSTSKDWVVLVQKGIADPMSVTITPWSATGQTGSVWVTATSMDKKASASIFVEVRDAGLAEIIVQ